MAILIPDMEMPEKCSDCRLCEGETMDGLCHAAQKWFDDEYFWWYTYQEGDIDESKPGNCPLVEVATYMPRRQAKDDTLKTLKEAFGLLEDSGFEL